MKIQNTPSETQEQDLILYPNRLKMLLGFAGSLMFVVAGIWLVSLREVLPIGIGIVSIGFFGLCGLLYLINLASPFPVLIVNKEGLRQQSHLGSVFVAWGEVATILLFKERSAYLNVYLSESGKETFSARHPWIWRISRLFGDLPMITLSPLLSPIPTQQVLEAIQKGYQHQIEEYNIAIR